MSKELYFVLINVIFYLSSIAICNKINLFKKKCNFYGIKFYFRKRDISKYIHVFSIFCN